MEKYFVSSIMSVMIVDGFCLFPFKHLTYDLYFILEDLLTAFLRHKLPHFTPNCSAFKSFTYIYAGSLDTIFHCRYVVGTKFVCNTTNRIYTIFALPRFLLAFKFSFSCFVRGRKLFFFEQGLWPKNLIWWKNF